MLNHLRIQNERLALESFAGANVGSLLVNTFPTLVKGIKSFFGSFTSDTPAITLSSKERAFVNEVKNHVYMDLCPLLAYVPEGLTAKYLDYTVPLLAAAEHASHIANAVLPSYATFLAKLINSNDQQLSTVSFDKVYKELSAKREVINAELGDCFEKGSVKTDSTFGNVIARNADWEKVFSASTAINKLINNVDRKVLNKKIDECSALLSVIYEKVKKNEFEGMSPETIRNLSDGAYQVAKELEFFSITYFKIQSFTVSLNRTIDHFSKIYRTW